ncbi:MAG: PDZ domain-containing protein [Lachnospiraceae bacterium]|nr:PDZ domain-containing protein [Lachnospiraceae bacterium]
MYEDRPSSGGFAKGLVTGIVATVIAAIIFVAVYLNSLSGGAITLESISKLGKIDKIIEENFYEPVDRNALIESMYKGLVQGLSDKYSIYFTKEEAVKADEATTGNFVGIGVVVSVRDDVTKKLIKTVYEDSPAKEAGILRGDIFIGVDDTDVTNMSLSESIALIQGESGTPVTIKVLRDGKELSFDMLRAKVNTPSVFSTMLDKGVGYLRISEFNSETAPSFRKEMKKLQEAGMTSVIYDLRQNPGGLVDEVLSVLDDILPAGVLVYTVDNKGRQQAFYSDDERVIDIPSVVLVDENSASSAEIFTAAMKDFKAATIVGKKTYGKGIVQYIYPLSDGSRIELTTKKYLTPNGDDIHGKGIEPDVEVEYSYTGDQEALRNKYEDEYTVSDYLGDSQINKAYSILTENK